MGVARDEDRHWYKDAVVYQLHVRSFCDSNADGIGDFRGLTGRLDYLQDLGVTAVWLLPFYPSPLKDDGYDIADYTSVNPDYGTLADFRRFLREAHKRGLRVITELVVNHTSDQHPWFQRARRAKPGSRWRDFYVWSDDPTRYGEARIIFQDFETSNWEWDPLAQAYYWHRFYNHQPDLNFDNPRVAEEILKVLDFWMGMGVDGMRLDAVPYLFEREGTNCENLPETHALLRRLRRHVDEHHPNRMLLAEANQWPEDAAEYFGDGDECHMAFHFPLMPRLFMALRMEDRFPIRDILSQTPAIPESCQWAMFLRNHDELTLEMVTDEERDYMYRVYANDPRARVNVGIRRRLAPLLGNDRRRMELMAALLLSLPGTPIIYYGDEIGMGDNIYLGDRNAVRTPMQWSADRNAGFSRATPQKLFLPAIIDPEYHFETVNVENQGNNYHSLLWWTRRVIALRKRFRAFGRGDLEFLTPEMHRVLVFLRTWEEERILVVANLSRFVQCVELDLSRFQGMVPIELFGHTRFPPVGELPYFLTLGPHAFYWFSLEPSEVVHADADTRPTVTARDSWRDALRPRGTGSLAAALETILPTRRWFAGKARTVRGTTIAARIPVAKNGEEQELVLARVEYTEGEEETYVCPLSFAAGEEAGRVANSRPGSVLARVEFAGEDREPGILYDATDDPAFARILLDIIRKRRRLKGHAGEIAGRRTHAFARVVATTDDDEMEPSPLGAEQSNTSIAFGQHAILKIFRKLDEGENPDFEIGRFLTERTSFTHIPPVAGALEFRSASGKVSTLGILQAYVPNEGDAWQHAQHALGRYFERMLEAGDREPPAAPRLDAAALLSAGDEALTDDDYELLGGYVDPACLLGRRTAELHRALASDTEDPAFAPEGFSSLYQRSLYQSMRNDLGRTFRLLDSVVGNLPEHVRDGARRVIALEGEAMTRIRAIVGERLDARRIRTHGDYHLGQVLFTGDDFVVIDFEGEPARSLSERRIKRSPLQDVAGMLRSFGYASHSELRRFDERGQVGGDSARRLEAWRRLWEARVSALFLGEYLRGLAGSGLLPDQRERLAAMLDAYLLDKAVYELRYELNSRPDWVDIPVSGLLQILLPDADAADE